MNTTAFQTFLNSDTIYAPSQIHEVLKVVRPYFRFSYVNTKTKYFNVPCAFDIETSSFFRTHDGVSEKVAIMYEWTFGIFGAVIIGRTWDEFETMMHELSKALNLNENKRLIVFIENYGFEFQFMRQHFEWDKVFSISNRTPIYGITTDGIEYRCSYLLSGYRLEVMGDNLQHYTVRKMVGDLNYDLIRHSRTPLTDKEIGYCANDVKVVMAYIAERIDEDGGIAKIPLTKTGYVRQYCRNSCFYEPGEPHKKSLKRLRYKDLMRGMQLTVDEYNQLKDAFQGGFTHANPFFSGKIIENVTSFDFTSSYPAVMISEMFPMGSAQFIEITSKEEFYRNMKLYCCIFDVEIFGLQSQLWQDSYISRSRCRGVRNATVNNGRIVSAEHLITTITNQDYAIIEKFYTWDKIRIYNFRRYRKGYLPTDFVKAIIKLYKDKTVLKGVEGKEREYGKSKEMLNSCY